MRALKQPRNKESGRRRARVVVVVRTLPPKEMRSTSTDTTEPPESPISGAAPLGRRRGEMAGPACSAQARPLLFLPINCLVRPSLPGFFACVAVAYKRRKEGGAGGRTVSLSLSSAPPFSLPLFPLGLPLGAEDLPFAVLYSLRHSCTSLLLQRSPPL